MSKNTRLTLIIYLLTAITIPLQFIFKAYLTQHISLLDAGIFFGLFGLVSLVGIYSDHGRRELLLHYIPKLISSKNENQLRGMVAITLLMQLVVGLLVSLLLAFFAPMVYQYICHNDCGYTSNSLRYFIYGFALFQLFIAISGSLESIVLGLGKSHLAKICEIIKLGGYSIVILLLNYYGKLDLAHLIQNIIYIPLLSTLFLLTNLLIYHRDLLFGSVDYSIWYKIKKPLFGAFAIAHAIGLYTLIDVVLVQSLSGGGNSALYTNAILMTNGYIFVIASIAPFIGSKISFFYHEISQHEMGKFLSKVSNVLIIVSLVGRGAMMSILWIASTLIHGDLALKVYYPAIILGIGSIFGALLQFLMLILSGLGMYRQKNKIMWFGVLLLLVSSYLLSMFIDGLYAVAISMSAVQCIMSLLIFYQLIKSYPSFSLHWKDVCVFGLLGLLGSLVGLVNYFYFSHSLLYALLFVVGYLLIIGLTIHSRYGGLKELYGDLFFTQKNEIS